MYKSEVETTELMFNNKHMSKNLKKALSLFWTFFKIGLFTFGGGYAMLPLIQEEVSTKKKWISEEEIQEVIAISEATPGPFAINAATYVGFKIFGILGSLLATLGIILPSLVIIFVISLFLEQFLAIELIAKAFKGIKVAVSLLIFVGAARLFKNMKKSVFAYIIFGSFFIISFVLIFVDFSISNIWFILLAALIGIIFELLLQKKKEDK